mmetsp:Transcript_37771/g.120027  ORF Transcript_37771/g.120027 Transcript_37771/m.120027 type:complete len:248 (+) Transcript_37771:1013-1756(+)
MWYCGAWWMATEYFASLSANSTRMGCSCGMAVSTLRTPRRSQWSSQGRRASGPSSPLPKTWPGSCFHGKSAMLGEVGRESQGATGAGADVEEEDAAAELGDPRGQAPLRDAGKDAKQLHSSPQEQASGQQVRPPVTWAHCTAICSWHWRLRSACAIMEPTSSSCTGRHRPCTPRSRPAKRQLDSSAASDSAWSTRCTCAGSAWSSRASFTRMDVQSMEVMRRQVTWPPLFSRFSEELHRGSWRFTQP